jgi:hypothetical protein
VKSRIINNKSTVAEINLKHGLHEKFNVFAGMAQDNFWNITILSPANELN